MPRIKYDILQLGVCSSEGKYTGDTDLAKSEMHVLYNAGHATAGCLVGRGELQLGTQSHHV